MLQYKAPIQDMSFILHDVLSVNQYNNLAGFAQCADGVMDQILEEAAKLSEEVLAPLNPIGDIQGCTRHPDGSVTTADGFKDAFRTLVDNGWNALSTNPEYGGQGLPYLLSSVVREMTVSANMAFDMYSGLTTGAYAALEVAASPEQKAMYLPKLSTGEWTGTMNLTEPQCGTDLGLLRTKAVPQDDGSYKLSGQKIWISSGEHDLADNIIHLVLARIEGAPEGVKGISLFVVPKFLVNPDGSLGDRNGVTCGGLEEKMGIHGNATCVMNYDEATGYLVGEIHKGLRAMFVMMNEARIGVGLQGLAQSERAYQAACTFAKERLQGRSLTGTKNPDGPADPIIVHPDVRRILMNARAFVEGARAFAYWLSLHNDLMRHAPDEATRTQSSDLVELLTPVLKAYLTDRGFFHVSECLQVYGGSGYTLEAGISQILRDTRITMIYEGTNGVQALDLVGRKLAANNGRALFALIQQMEEFIAEQPDDDALSPIMQGLERAKAYLQDATAWLMKNAISNFENAGAASSDYLHLLGNTVMGYMWAKMAVKAHAALRSGGGDKHFHGDKLITARHYFERIAPECVMHLEKLKAGATTLMEIPAERF